MHGLLEPGTYSLRVASTRILERWEAGPSRPHFIPRQLPKLSEARPQPQPQPVDTVPRSNYTYGAANGANGAPDDVMHSPARYGRNMTDSQQVRPVMDCTSESESDRSSGMEQHRRTGSVGVSEIVEEHAKEGKVRSSSILSIGGGALPCQVSGISQQQSASAQTASCDGPGPKVAVVNPSNSTDSGQGIVGAGTAAYSLSGVPSRKRGARVGAVTGVFEKVHQTEDEQSGVCKFFVNTGHCPRGGECPYSHAAPAAAVAARKLWLSNR